MKKFARRGCPAFTATKRRVRRKGTRKTRLCTTGANAPEGKQDADCSVSNGVFSLLLLMLRYQGSNALPVTGKLAEMRLDVPHKIFSATSRDRRFFLWER